MLVYLTGSPISTRKHPLSLDIAPQVSESRTQALLARAEILHSSSPDGLSRKVKHLRVLRHVVQLRTTKRGGYAILVWMWLSDDSRSRCAWFLGRSEDQLCRTWERIPWDTLRFKTDAA
jgi:hypothetical protein